jgi:hypothetical protein
MKKRVMIISLTLLIVILASTPAFALYYPNQFYDDRSWTWEYNAPLTSSYNCLGYATGSMYWEWPWGGSDPTASQAAWYLSTYYGYQSFNWGTPYIPKIVSYGTSSDIGHFSKVPAGASYSIAKWGSLERFKHYSWNPYNSGSDAWGPYYGYAVQGYR